MENNRFYANQSCQKELEQQLKESFLEIKLLKQENKYLSSNFEEFKLKQEETRKLQQLVVELEQRVLTLEEENAKQEAEIGYLRGFSQSKEIQINQKASYVQLEQELQDLQIYLKKFIQLHDCLIEQIPNLNLQLCWKEINQVLKNQFNTNQSIQNLQDELKLIETTYKELVHCKDNGLTPLQEMAKQQSIRESRVEIERIRKEVQLKQMDLKQFEKKLSELQNEFTYISRIETRKNNVQIEAEKQLIDFRKGISTTKNQNNNNASLMRDTFKERDTYKEMMIPERLRDQSEVLPVPSSIKRFQRPYIEINDRYDDYQEAKTPIEKTIDQTRKKLSRQLSQASSLRDQKYI
ncbi:unnamed protein product [Paramecium sonneborni]|uniref:Uncharacterized protein n=1 Tax=Paramecium sonneborni TaxID=65129 RepID=A0A8S1R353_9CILI|nr:unnamed protein product [Paramecium sonneborni]